ncbi:MAG: insulinase family protein [Thermodesulfobacteriota bacterium]|nr:insulinase family protein [Thermodesulfobacteriota bacterium]
MTATRQLPDTFTLISTTALPEINATLLQLRHKVTGARLVHIAADDSNNLFAVAFKTPPSDSTGVAHILEHTALCGSIHYPVRDPFFTMLKRSLNTFMNAFTASDWTCYPFSSQNHKDFYNLLGIYLDAAFFPLLRERDFTQEGHRLEFAQADDATTPLTFKGVVFNEMKGAMADPSSLLSRSTTRHLYPTTCYHHNSGGEPENIPDLSWQQLRDFHAEFYHPSNACFFSYGNFPLAEHLAVIEKQVLSKFTMRQVNSIVPPEQRLTAPVKVCESFPIDSGEELTGKSMVHLSWLTSDISDSFQNLAMTLLSQLLLGNPAAPLYKALLDSGLGTNLTPGCGFHDDYRTTCFAVGLQGSDADKTDAIEQLILDTLHNIADEGFSTERIEATIHRLELANREVGGDSYPYAISLMFRILGPWLHCDDPISALQLDDNLKKLRQKLAEGSFFEELIRTWLLNNNHRITLCLRPDPEMGAKMEQQEQQRLSTISKTLTDNDKQQLVDQAQQLQQDQEDNEDLSCLPTLQLSDIDTSEPEVVSRSVELAGQTVMLYPQPTNGLGYINLYFSCDHIDESLRPYLPLFSTVLTQIGTGDASYLEMAQRIEAGTGGIHASVEILDDIDNLDSFQPLLRLHGKALTRNMDKLSEILADLCSSANFSDQERLATVIGQIKSSWENAIPGSGHSYAACAAAGELTPAGKQREQWSGFTQLKLIKQVAKLGADQLGEIVLIMQKIAKTIIDRRHVKAAITAEEAQLPAAQVAMKTLLEQIPQRSAVTTPQPLTAVNPSAVQLGWITSIPVSYVTQVFRTVPFNHPDSAALKILAALLRANFLHREIREKGGAYGGRANSSSESGVFSLLSYRDPQLLRTLDVYQQALAWIQKGDFDNEKIKEAVLAVFGVHDRPLSPSGRGSNEFANQQQGMTHSLRQQFRNRLLAVTKEQLLYVAKHYLSDQLDQSPISILSNDEALHTASKTLTQLQIKRL